MFPGSLDPGEVLGLTIHASYFDRDLRMLPFGIIYASAVHLNLPDTGRLSRILA